VAFVCLHCRVHIGPVDFDVTLGLEPVCDRLAGVAFEFYADAHDALLVTKQSVGFLLHKRLKRRGEVEVDAGDDQFVVILSVHDAALWLGFSAARADHPPWLKYFTRKLVPSPREALQTFSAVVLTGGSSGIGKSFIDLGSTLAPHLWFCNLSRSTPVINNPQLKLCHIACDLSDTEAVGRAAGEVESFLQREVPAGRVLLINNSGFGSYGLFPEPNLSHHLEMVDVNIRAVVELTGLLLPTLKARGGVIVNVASTVSFQPMPFMATYAASKAFVLHWSVALDYELRGTGVRTLTVCPGPTASRFSARAGLNSTGGRDSLSMSSDEVVMESLAALANRKSLVVTGWKNKISALAGGTAPKRLAAWVAAKVVRRFRMRQVKR
jgi:short-subunit dehydrogenase